MAQKMFSGNSVAETMERIKVELGDDVSIIDIRHISKDQVEIVVEGMFSTSAAKQPEGEPVRLASKVIREVRTQQTNEKPIVEDSLESSLRYLLLEKAGIGKEFADLIINSWASTKGSFSERLETILPLGIEVHEEINFHNRFVAIMGSCGAGKTSAAFKLAHQFSVCCGIQCGVLHLDAGKRSIYENAPEGLVVPIVSCPLSECFPATLGRALSEFSECDLVFIDLPSSTVEGNDESSAQCARLMSLLKSVEVLVALDARLQKSMLKKVVSTAKTYGDVRAIITRVDEAASLAIPLSCLYEERVPLAFLSNGPLIPDNIEPASVVRIAWMLAKQLLASGIDVHRISKVVEGVNTQANGIIKGRTGVAPVSFSEFV